MKVYVIWSEWDLGLTGAICKSEEVAERMLREALEEQFPDEPDYQYDEVIDGLVGWGEQEVIT